MSSVVPFSKYHGCENDFVVVEHEGSLNSDDKAFYAMLAPSILDRRRGVGADSLLVLSLHEMGRACMTIFERDGLESEMCGNGLRCVASHLASRGESFPMDIDTGAGMKVVEKVDDGLFRVNMGPPSFAHTHLHEAYSEKSFPLLANVENQDWELFTVSMGNPHAVVFCQTEEEMDAIGSLGPQLETHEAFRNRTNVEFVWEDSKGKLKVRVWERSAGETRCCGTGACAVAAAYLKQHPRENMVRVSFPGGDLEVEWDGQGDVYMTGPAQMVFEGCYRWSSDKGEA